MLVKKKMLGKKYVLFDFCFIVITLQGLLSKNE